MARKSKVAREAREAREAAEREAVEAVWHMRGEAWCRRRGAWWLRVEQRYKSYSRDMAWLAILQAQGNYALTSAHLGDVATTDLDVVRAAADAWLVEVTAPLMQLVADGVPAMALLEVV